MDESQYWTNLEYRVTRELQGMRDNRVRFLWCDGFSAEEYLVSDVPPRINGRVWICGGQRQNEWTFTMALPRAVSSRDAIEWEVLLPPDRVTEWLAVDTARGHINIDLEKI